MFEACKHKVETEGSEPSMDSVRRTICWSSKALFDGVHPSSDSAGKPWPVWSSEALLARSPLCSLDQPLFGVLWSLKGDIKWYVDELHLRSHSSNVPCDFCPVDKNTEPDMWPTNFAADAAWKAQMYSADQWRAKNPEMTLILKSFTFVSSLNVEPDELHVLHLGVSQYFLGSVLRLLVYSVLPGKPCCNMKKVWSMIVDEYRSDNHSPDTLQTVKAAQDFMKLAESFLADYTCLGLHADERGDLLFSAVPKLHWLWHLAHRAQFLNPRRAACFIDEDFAKHMKSLATKCTASVQLHNVPDKMFENYGWALKLQKLSRRNS